MKRALFVASLGILALAAACQEPEETAPGATVPSPTPAASSPAATVPPAPSTTPATMPRPLGQVLLPVADTSALITEGGAYLLEVETGRLWHSPNYLAGSWSPDGKTMVRKACCAGDGGLDIIDVSEGTATRIVDGDVSDAAWAPDGTRIAFRFSDGQGPPGLYIVNGDGTGLKPVSGPSAGWIIEWSPRGDRIVVSPPPRSALLLDVSTGETTQLTDTFNGLDWSPDGTRLVFADDTGLYMHNVDTAERTLLASGPSFGPAWSPNGTAIAFYFGEHLPILRDPEVRLPILHLLDLREPLRPKPLPPSFHASWSPDGTRFAYSSEGCMTGDWDIYVANADGSSERRLTWTPDDVEEGPEWSPSGSTVAFSTFDSLTVVDVGSGQERTLVVSAGPEAGADLHLHEEPWSPDGRYITFLVSFGHGICD